MEEFRNRQDYCRQVVNILEDNVWGVPDDLKALIRMLKESIALLETNIQVADSKEEEETKKFSIQVYKYIYIYCLFVCLSKNDFLSI